MGVTSSLEISSLSKNYIKLITGTKDDIDYILIERDPDILYYDEMMLAKYSELEYACKVNDNLLFVYVSELPDDLFFKISYSFKRKKYYIEISKEKFNLSLSIYDTSYLFSKIVKSLFLLDNIPFREKPGYSEFDRHMMSIKFGLENFDNFKPSVFISTFVHGDSQINLLQKCMKSLDLDELRILTYEELLDWCQRI